MRIEQSFSVSRPPEVGFDYLTNPANLAAWQTSKTSVEQLTAGAPQLGTRVRERTKSPRGKEFEQIVEFTEFNRPARVHAHIVEGPYPIDGTWSFASDDAGTRVDFVAERELPGVPRLLQPLAKRLMAASPRPPSTRAVSIGGVRHMRSRRVEIGCGDERDKVCSSSWLSVRAAPRAGAPLAIRGCG